MEKYHVNLIRNGVGIGDDWQADSLVDLLQDLRDAMIAERIPDNYDFIEIKYLGDAQ